MSITVVVAEMPTNQAGVTALQNLATQISPIPHGVLQASLNVWLINQEIAPAFLQKLLQTAARGGQTLHCHTASDHRLVPIP